MWIEDSIKLRKHFLCHIKYLVIGISIHTSWSTSNLDYFTASFISYVWKGINEDTPIPIKELYIELISPFLPPSRDIIPTSSWSTPILIVNIPLARVLVQFLSFCFKSTIILWLSLLSNLISYMQNTTNQFFFFFFFW